MGHYGFLHHARPIPRIFGNWPTQTDETGPNERGHNAQEEEADCSWPNANAPGPKLGDIGEIIGSRNCSARLSIGGVAQAGNRGEKNAS